MKIAISSVLLVAGCALAAPLAAQEAPAGSSAPNQAQGAMQAQAATDVSDGEVDSFASALVDINKVQADETIAAADKQKQMVAVLQKNNLEPARFNEIAQAAQTDPDLNKRIQTAAQAKAGAQ